MSNQANIVQNDIARAVYLVDANGNPTTSTNPPSVNATVAGDTAHGAIDTGNPVKIGGVAASTAPTQVPVGDRVQAWMGRNGQVVTALADINGATATMNQPGDAQGTQSGPATASQTLVYNGTNWDLFRANQDNISLINVSNVSGTQTSADQTNYNGRGVKIWFNIAAFGAALTLSVQYKDRVSGQYISALSSAAISANTFTQYTIYPGITATANVSISDVLPRTWRVQVTGASGSTFTVGASVIV